MLRLYDAGADSDTYETPVDISTVRSYHIRQHHLLNVLLFHGDCHGRGGGSVHHIHYYHLQLWREKFICCCRCYHRCLRMILRNARVARGRRPSSSITWPRSLWCRTAKSYTWKAAKLVHHMARVAMVSYRQELHVEGGQARPSHG